MAPRHRPNYSFYCVVIRGCWLDTGVFEVPWNGATWARVDVHVFGSPEALKEITFAGVANLPIYVAKKGDI